MCGIMAMYSPRGTISPSALERATSRLAHLGPDGQRTWYSGDRRVGLGHARLSIIDLATGEQPIASEDLIPIRQSDLADHFADATWQAETLCFNAHGVAKYLLSRAVRHAGYKVVLTGEGSDEILAGYPPFR